LRVEDWDSFDFAYTLDIRGLIPHILAIEAYKAAALGPVLPPRWLEVPDALAPTGVDPSSPAPDSSVAQQPRQDQAATLREKTRLPVRDTSKARAWVKQRCVPGSAPLSVSDILTLQGMVAEEHGVKGSTAGALRTTPVEVGRELVGGFHQGAPAKQLPLLMDRYVEFIDGATLRSLPALIHALLAHFFLDTIHPFVDGNGRTSRLVAAAILSRHGYNLHGSYALVRYFYRHDILYHTILHRIWKRCPFEVTPFVAFGMQGFVLELRSVDSFIKMKLNRIGRDTAVPAFAGRIGARPRGLH
jgi:Fic/DOC family